MNFVFKCPCFQQITAGPIPTEGESTVCLGLMGNAHIRLQPVSEGDTPNFGIYREL